MAAEEVLQRIGQVVDQVPAVGHLDGVGRAVPRPFGIGAAAVAGDDLDAGMRPQPGRQAAAGAIGQEIDGAVPLQVDQDRAVGQALVDRPVVDAEHGRRRQRQPRAPARIKPQQGVGADRHPELGRQPRPGLAPEGDGDGE